MIHILKTHPEPFEAVWERRKSAEFRRDDRVPRFALHDTLYLREWDPDALSYSGRVILARVTDIRREATFGIPEGYAMLSIVAFELHTTLPGEG